jgi:hypothetical protein
MDTGWNGGFWVSQRCTDGFRNLIVPGAVLDPMPCIECHELRYLLPGLWRVRVRVFVFLESEAAWHGMDKLRLGGLHIPIPTNNIPATKQIVLTLPPATLFARSHSLSHVAPRLNEQSFASTSPLLLAVLHTHTKYPHYFAMCLRRTYLSFCCSKCKLITKPCLRHRLLDACVAENRYSALLTRCHRRFATGRLSSSLAVNSVRRRVAAALLLSGLVRLPVDASGSNGVKASSLRFNLFFSQSYSSSRLP